MVKLAKKRKTNSSKKSLTSNPMVRNTNTKLKTAKGRKTSSSSWLQRQLNDPYVQASKRDGYRSRAAYKLLQMNEKHQNFARIFCKISENYELIV